MKFSLLGHYMWDPDLKKTKKILSDNGFNPDEIDSMVKARINKIGTVFYSHLNLKLPLPSQ
jgi:hypothetical protein